MKTYSETQGEEPLDWNEALNAKNKDWDYLYNMSQNWVTCACGNQCSTISRDSTGKPMDNKLRTLGAIFFGAIYSHKTRQSKEILQQIEIRSSQLINQINNK